MRSTPRLLRAASTLSLSRRRARPPPLASPPSGTILHRSRLCPTQHPHHIQFRSFARTSDPHAGGAGETPADKARSFVVSVGHEPEVAKGVVNALVESGLSGEALLSTVRSLAGRWEVGEDEGLDALVASVQQTMARTEGKRTVQIWVVPPNAWRSGEEEEDKLEGEGGDGSRYETDEERKAMMKRAFPVQSVEGVSLTDVAKFGEGEGASTLGEYMECACSGIMACSTCHVVVEPFWFEKVGGPSEAEQDMLDLAYSPRYTSRLGCQLVLRPDLDGLVVRLPKGCNNLMDHIPFEG